MQDRAAVKYLDNTTAAGAVTSANIGFQGTGSAAVVVTFFGGGVQQLCFAVAQGMKGWGNQHEHHATHGIPMPVVYIP
jgi:hypothetical protein